jgi:hypothetical protein
MIEKLISGNDIESEITAALLEIHTEGPSDPITFEKLAYIKKFHSDEFKKHENKILSAMGLFYKTSEAKSILEEVYQIYANAIQEETKQVFTPMQASAYKEIVKNRYFSFSAPTSSGKSYLFRELIAQTPGDIIIVVPSRALIAEYYYEVLQHVDNSTLVLQFIHNIKTDNIKRRVYIVTPERASELFKFHKEFNLELILLDEAQISEEPMRGMTFDAFVRRADKIFPNAKKVFAHPFVDNPDAQLEKHGFQTSASSKNFNYYAVGKIFIATQGGCFEYFSPNIECKTVPIANDVVSEVLSKGGTLLVYMSKNKIYDGGYLLDFSKYIELCEKITNPVAVGLIEELRKFIGATRGESEKHSTLIDLLEKGIVIHHGSMPLTARLLVEKFVRLRFARICFATSTLNQGINMPFDVVWIDNFTRMNALTLKNLIGRSGRTTSNDYLDYGLTVIKSENVRTFKDRFKETVKLKPTSTLDDEISKVNEDFKDLVEAVKGDSYNDDLHLTNAQIARIENADIDADIKYILDNLLIDGKPITGKDYYELSEVARTKIKSCFKTMYIQHLRRRELSRAESSVLSAAIPIMLWHIQGKSFSEIVSLRHAFLSEKDKRREILSGVKAGRITVEAANKQMAELLIRYSPIPSPLPNSELRVAPLFPNTSVDRIDYDLIVYDTYDYLDKVISLSLVDPLCATFEVYSSKHNDQRAEVLKNYIRYGTNEIVEMWLLKYGFGHEDIAWIKVHIDNISEKRIDFKATVRTLPEEKLSIISRYL